MVASAHDNPGRSMSEIPTLARVVVQALSGQSVDLEPGDVADLDHEISRLLDRAGLSIADLDAIRDERREAGLAWPFYVPAPDRHGIGAAQLKATLDAVISDLGVGVAPIAVRDGNQPKDAVDARLIAERPPHHGSVG